MFCTALGRVSEDGNGEGEHNDEVRDKEPSSVGNELDPVLKKVGGNTGEYESAPDNSFLGRILNPSRFKDNNRNDVDTLSYHGSVGSVGDLDSIGSFAHFGLEANKKKEDQTVGAYLMCCDAS